MRAVVQKWGNSLGLRIPAPLALRKNIKEGSVVELIEHKDGIVVQAEAEPTLESLLKQIKPNSRPEVVEWGRSRGKEAW